MDAVDEQIIAILRENGRISFSELGRQVGLSTNAAAARVRRLEKAGVIVGYQAVLGSDAPDGVAGLEAFIDVRLAPEHDSDEFLAWTRSVRDVIDAVHLTGPYDYLLHVRTHDTSTLNQLLRTLKKDGGASHTQTRLALRDAPRA